LFGNESGNYQTSIQIDNLGKAIYVVENLTPNTYYFVSTAFKFQRRRKRILERGGKSSQLAGNKIAIGMNVGTEHTACRVHVAAVTSVLVAYLSNSSIALVGVGRFIPPE